MTFVVTTVSHRGIWQLTDHQLTCGIDPSSDTSIKHVLVEGSDGKALLAYAGIGQVGTTPISEWVRKVLRGRCRTIEQHLWVLKEAANKRLVPISRSRGIFHTFSVGAFKDGWPMFYLVTNRRRRAGIEYVADFFDWHGWKLGERRSTMVINLEGTGALAVSPEEVRRSISRVINRRAAKASLIRDVTAALAHVNRSVSKDPQSWMHGQPTVSEHCVVTSLSNPTAGAVRTFCGWEKGRERPALQDIAGSFDVTALWEAIGPVVIADMERRLEQMQKGETADEPIDGDHLNTLLKQQDFEPTDKLG
jgi:hypothetical protein